MVDHQELVGELGMLEKLSTQDRLKLARKRRLQQLKRWTQYEKQLEKDNTKKRKSGVMAAGKPRNNVNKMARNVRFVSSVMLLEAAARNDIDEGEFETFEIFSFCRFEKQHPLLRNIVVDSR